MKFEYPSELPVSAARSDIAEAVRSSQVVIVSGQTGSGKTTQLPKILALSIRIVKTYLSKSESTYVLYNITLGAELRYLNRFYVENNVCGVFNLRFLSLQAMSLKKCRALIRHLFLGPRLLKCTQRSFEWLGCIAASSFKHTGFWLPHISTAAVCSAFCQKKSRNKGCDSLLFIFRHERTRLHAGRKNDLSLRFAESLQIIDKLVQILRRFKTTGQNLRILAGHAVASDDVPASFDVRVKFVFAFGARHKLTNALIGYPSFLQSTAAWNPVIYPCSFRRAILELTAGAEIKHRLLSLLETFAHPVPDILRWCGQSDPYKSLHVI